VKILNLYAGIGGNRKLWGDEHDITAIEYNPEIAAVYQDLFPNDKVIVTDAHQYLVENVMDGWDFIWSSPPCPSHSRINTDGQKAPRYPEMSLYQQIIMLNNNWYKGKWCVENVIPYYAPLINPAVEMGRHLFWAKFKIPKVGLLSGIQGIKGSNSRYGFNIKNLKIKHDKRQILRNLVDPNLGLHILKCAREKVVTLETFA